VPGAYDDCSDVTLTNNAPQVLNVGTTTIIWTATDASGNSVSCESTVIVIDQEIPTILCPPDITQTENTTVYVDPPVTADNCGVASVLNNFNNTSDGSGIYPPGLSEVIWTVTDIHGNTASCTQYIYIQC